MTSKRGVRAPPEIPHGFYVAHRILLGRQIEGQDWFSTNPVKGLLPALCLPTNDPVKISRLPLASDVLYKEKPLSTHTSGNSEPSFQISSLIPSFLLSFLFIVININHLFGVVPLWDFSFF